ncbi:hypothetical protein [Pararobbsia silviterrae]|uniref:Uncharacterized protein n=1 Tax=Pararobbsia silviterrae TaxID=1792498 RepID=A0A494XUN5_9BURK|nr:hypothetical protein [Pararobbsia silviterrae]RKP53421.1 hypothetical protein D7S86_17095 [Pararobbsia silviterrae]
MNVTNLDKLLLARAFHPSADHDIDAGRYLGEFGEDAAGKRRARCPLCLRHALDVVVDDEGAAVGFVHRERASASRCPLAAQSVQPQALQVAHARDLRCHRQNRAAFVARWRAHYSLMKAQVEALTIARLISLVAYADAVNLWSHPGLRQSDMPYVLLALGELIAEHSDAVSTQWVRFVFNGTVRTVDDLWTTRTATPTLFRVRYRTDTVGSLPSWRDVVACDEVVFGTLDDPPFDGAIHTADAMRFEAFVQSDDGLGTPADVPSDDVSQTLSGSQDSVRQSLENYAVYTMRAYARRRGKSA